MWCWIADRENRKCFVRPAAIASIALPGSIPDKEIPTHRCGGIAIGRIPPATFMLKAAQSRAQAVTVLKLSI
jgi:hypothetical protein